MGRKNSAKDRTHPVLPVFPLILPVIFPGAEYEQILEFEDDESAGRAKKFLGRFGRIIAANVRDPANPDRSLDNLLPVNMLCRVLAATADRQLILNLTGHWRVFIKDISVGGVLPSVQWARMPEENVGADEIATQDVLEPLRIVRDCFARLIHPHIPPLWMNAVSPRTLPILIDAVSWTLARSESEKIAGDLFQILCDPRVLRRLAFLAELLERIVRNPGLMGADAFSVPVEQDKEGSKSDHPLNRRYGAIKDRLPAIVRQRIEELLPHVAGESETSHINARYVEVLLQLPWADSTNDPVDFQRVRAVLEEDHWGLDKVKERIPEFLATQRCNPKSRGSILCFVGPPGVGKTSLGASIARALGRKFERMSLGGVHDEAEIRGHRRTYIGALPGRILQAIRRAGTNNPVLMLDEIDKLGRSGHGDPASALLEILDPAQNNTFYDNYLDLPFDLSRVFFITTANTLDSIPSALLDRMEIVHLACYGAEEKAEIARRFTIRQLHEDYGMVSADASLPHCPPVTVSFTDPALRLIVSRYTADGGMRETEQRIGTILRKILLASAMGETPAFVVTARNVKKYLGDPPVREWFPDLGFLRPGVAVVIYVTTNGNGEIGCVEASYRPSSHFDCLSTGSLGDVLAESVEVAIDRLIHTGGVLEGISNKIFIHVHFPKGATPKDGPSAGLQTFAACFSVLIREPLKPYFAATGEIALAQGTVFPVGGIRAKLLAAERAGIREVVIPRANAKDLADLSPAMRARTDVIETRRLRKTLQAVSREKKTRFTVYCVDKPEEVLALAFPDHFPPSPEVLSVLTGGGAI
ncbi:MAG: S16 family serine protease [Patescibacteria group bacterium]